MSCRSPSRLTLCYWRWGVSQYCRGYSFRLLCYASSIFFPGEFGSVVKIVMSFSVKNMTNHRFSSPEKAFRQCADACRSTGIVTNAHKFSICEHWYDLYWKHFRNVNFFDIASAASWACVQVKTILYLTCTGERVYDMIITNRESDCDSVVSEILWT